MEDNKNIEVLRGDPKKALMKLAIPMVFALLLISFNNIIDRIWVAGLGTEALAAIGFIAPLYMIVIGIGNGLSAGSNSSISRYIGAKERAKASNSSLHAILIVGVVSIIIPILGLCFLDQLIVYMGATSVMDYARDYGIPILVGSFAFLYNLLFSSQLRAEGDMKKATFILVAIEVINIILDPIFIYYFHMGIGGAAIATVVSSIIPTFIAIYWLFIEKNTYLDYNIHNFKYNSEYVRDILLVGIPASIEEFIISVTNIVFNSMLVVVAGTNIIAAFNITFTILQLGMMPCIAIGTATVTVAGVAYGAREYDKLKTVCYYAIAISMVIASIITVLLIIFAPQVSLLFSYNQSNSEFYNLLVDMVRMLSVFLVVIPVGGICAMLFQGVGKGTLSLALTIVRELLFVIVISYILGIVLGYGTMGIIVGIILGLSVGSVIAFVAFKVFMKRITSDSKVNT